jgi:FAD binding domain/Berberine and berberine like
MMNMAGLGEELDGELFVPDSPGYEAVRRPANPRYRDVHPRLVIRCGSVADVALGIGYARETGIPIVARGGGHCFAGRSSTDGIVLDLAGLDTISVADDGLATVGAGARLAQVYAAPQAILFGASLQEEAPTRELLQELCSVAGASPEVDVRGGLAYHHLKNSFEDLDPREEPVLGLRIRSEFFTRPMRLSTIDALLSTLIDGEATGRRQLTFTALGGAYNRVPDTATAFVHRRELFILEHIAEAPSAWVDRSWEVAHVDGSGGVYPNFPDPQLNNWATAYHAGNYPRLAAAKKAYDPDRLFEFPQSI